MIDTNNRINIKDYKTLIVYQKSVEFEDEIYKLLKGFPKEEKYRITDQMERASTSIILNLIKGVSQEYKKQTIKSCSVALGSANEMRHWILISRNRQYINLESFDYLDDLLEQIIKMLIGYMNMIRESGISETYRINKKIHIKDFRTLKVYQKSLQLTDEIYELIDGLSNEEKYGIANKFINTANAIGANLSEGAGQIYKGSTLVHCNIALRKANATKHLIDLAHRQDYIDAKAVHYLSGLLDEICRMLIGYMNMVKREIE